MKQNIKLIFWAVVIVIGVNIFLPKYEPETLYSPQDLEDVSEFLIYQKQYTQTLPLYCQKNNYDLSRLKQEFESMHQKQITQAQNFLAKFTPQERLSFYAEFDKTYSEMEPMILENIMADFQKNKDIHWSAQQEFSPYDYCAWLDAHAAEVLTKYQK